ncbi:MAG: ATPase domain-containing protein, partial [Methanosarcinaceae archaeon]|nr:ATPase domain-containing protein [Methanosarcinaceae archaeon]
MANVCSFEIPRDEFNRKLGGGFPPGSLVVIEGGSGGGKSTICQRMIFGLLENKHSVTFVSTQQTTKGFINQMYSLDYPIATYLLNGSFLFIPVIPLVQAAKSRIDFLERLMGAKELFENKIIVIDTISSLIKYSVDNEKSLELVSFFKKLNGMGKIIILTVEPSQLSEDITSMFRSSCDIYISLIVKPMAN